MDTCDPGGNKNNNGPEVPNLADLCALIPNGAHLSTLANNLAHPFNADQIFDTDFNFDDIVFQQNHQTKNISTNNNNSLNNQSNGASAASSSLNTSTSSNNSNTENSSSSQNILQQHAELIQAAQSGNATQAQLQALQNLKIKYTSGESDTADSALLRLSRDSISSGSNSNQSRSNSSDSNNLCSGNNSDSGNSTNGNKSPRISQEKLQNSQNSQNLGSNLQNLQNSPPNFQQNGLTPQQVQHIAQQAQQQAQQQGLSPQHAAAFAQAAMQDAFFRSSGSSNSSSRNHSSNSSISNISASQQARLEADALCIEPERTGSKKTAYNEKWGVKVLKAWCIENQVDTEFEKLTPECLDKLLVKFWTEVRKSNGDYYGRNSLCEVLKKILR